MKKKQILCVNGRSIPPGCYNIGVIKNIFLLVLCTLFDIDRENEALKESWLNQKIFPNTI